MGRPFMHLASHDVPRHELLEPTWHDVRPSYENEFAGMLIEERRTEI